MKDRKTKSRVIVLATIALFAIVALCFAAFLFARSSNGLQAQKIGVSLPDELPSVSFEEAERDEESASQEASPSEQTSQNQASPLANQESSGSSKPSESSSSSSDGVEEHVHSWVYHEAVYRDDPVYESRVVCSCGSVYENTTMWGEHNLEVGPPGHSYSVRKVQVDTVRVMVSPESWSCSCGATK